MRHYVSLHTNLRDQTSHFHLYVNAEYVNKAKQRQRSRWLLGSNLSLAVFDPLISWRTLCIGFLFLQHIGSEDGTQSHNRQYFPFSFIHSELGQGFQLARLDESGARQSKCFLTTMKSG